MYTLLKIILGLVLLLLLTAVFLFFRYPFAFQEIASLPGALKSPNIPQPDPQISSIAQLDAFIADQLEAKSVHGTAVAIVADGEIVWSKGYGFANAETELPATPDTPFMIGSISKAVTGIALMHAVETGQLDLDTDINAYLDFAVTNPQIAVGHSITLRHLATHTSGIIDRDWLYTNSYEIGDPTASLGQFLFNYLAESGKHYRPDDNFLPSIPGETAEYSNIAASLAGHIVGEATSSRLDKYAQTNIFEPLGLTNTGWFLADFEDVSQIAQPYALANRPHPHYGYPTWPEGQLRMSANDLARLLAMVMNGGEIDGRRILQSETVAAMLAKQPFSGLEAESGEGIFWSYTRGGMIGHNGGDHGVTTTMYFNPESNIGVVVLANASPHRAFEPVFTITRQIVTCSSTPAIIESIAQD